ncbi:Glutathione S-transferase [Rhynchospora pubera]|uniref:glutathione transferase n=1 Tax=Rhynchospora pubera TaxID=906938 RepID=A0AAV8F1K5_9POAL|nr:Glutathione S-transferase [Rhynchospora pubera]
MTEGELKLLGRWSSPFVIRVKMMLEQKGLSYVYIEQDLLNKSELLLKHNPIYKKVPVLIHGDRDICESLVILQYIDENWSKTGPMFPVDPYERAIARFWAAYIDDKLLSSFIVIMKAATEEEKAGKIADAHAALAIRIRCCATPRVAHYEPSDFDRTVHFLRAYQSRLHARGSLVHWILIKRPEYRATRCVARQRISISALELLEGAFMKCAAGKDFFGGDVIGYLDVTLGACLAWIKAVERISGAKLLDETKVPLLMEWVKRFLATDCAKNTLPDVERVEKYGRDLQVTRWNVGFG